MRYVRIKYEINKDKLYAKITIEYKEDNKTSIT